MKTKSKILESGPLEILFSGNATAKLLDFMVSSQEWDYSESDIARNSGISIRTVQRELSKLLDYKLIKMIRPVGSAKMYQLDKTHRTGELLERLVLALAQNDIRKQTAQPLVKTRVKVKEIETDAEHEKILA